MEKPILFCRESGEKQQETILFLHAGGLSGKSWLPVMERLPEFHCLAPDLPGQGGSRGIPFSFEACVDGCVRLIHERVPNQKVHLAALSLGGPAAFSLLGKYPDLIDHVLISGCSGQIPAWQTRLAKSSLWTYRLFKPQTLARLTLQQQGIPVEYRALVEEDLAQSTDPNFMRPMLDALSRWELPHDISQPLLLVVGEKEPRAARRFTQHYLAKYPHASGLLAPGMRHAWSLQDPDAFAELLRAWLRDCPLPQGYQPLG
ncbi:alpha/beta fold hydrolase [Pelolinea submarina]|uniref:Pimeloyl-ACP methyl ester carboxylesterase n=1 Tax=Pelolinea submarina TaxID=913107 RepID=A0A347ZWQ6_9CHLR|nr:alpha/beta hydrolase [Pelolinea submarina]REG05480.1 pimeloyl-ACP methyl ester carboxylesterase [Pelolinea submarina]BBB49737.1 isochorismate synthase /2-succinyl-5-enolpyruvyl-6-hydroxy-3-cyclohexene-1-carboxylate synthase /2-succinyl-6-hydroxy-2,4-cyclohexadiene-1-carboxylate synthase /O-succinylbenzoate synthase [Pelolinea submarina]